MKSAAAHEKSERARIDSQVLPYICEMADGFLEVVDVPNMPAFLLAIAIGNIPLLGYIFKCHFLKSLKVHSLEMTVRPDEFLQLDGEDMSGKLGEKISIEFAAQVQMLRLED